MTAINPLEELLWDPSVSEIMVTGPDDVWIERRGIERRGRFEHTGVQFLDEEHLQRIIENFASSDGCRCDGRDPQYYDCILHCDGAPFDGSRVNAILDATDGHWKLNIRKCGNDDDADVSHQHIDDGFSSQSMAEYYSSIISARMGISDAQIRSLHRTYRLGRRSTSLTNDNPPTILRKLTMSETSESEPTSISLMTGEAAHDMQDDEILSILKLGESELRARGYRMGWHRPVKYAGVIYILVNPAFPSLVKIGYADDIEKRLRSLNRNSGLPDPYHCYATYRVKKRLEDLKLHCLIDTLDSDLRHTSNREFYDMEKEKAFHILYAIAQINGDEDLLQLNPLDDDFFADCADLKALSEDANTAQKPKLKRMTFEEIGISVGAVLHFKEDSSVTVTVADAKSTVIMADGSRQKISRAVGIIKEAAGTANTSGSYQGAAYFSYEGELLKDRRARLLSQTEAG